MNQPNFVLTKKHFATRGQITIVTDWSPQGAAYDRHAVLPYTDGLSGQQFLTAHLLGKADGLPALSCDEPDKLLEYAWEYLTTGMPSDLLDLVALARQLEKRGLKLPEPTKLGRSLQQRRVYAGAV